MKTALNKFYDDARLESFQDFFFELRKYARGTQSPQSSKTRVWIIIDEVVLFEKLIKLPEEQALGPFKWIVTGSAGIGSWVAERHLEDLVFDLPRFTQQQCFDFAKKLCNALGINLEDGIDGVPIEGVDDWLEERFGGVVGYIAEMFLKIAKGEPNPVSQYMLALSDRVNTVISTAAKKGGISGKALAEVWLNEIKSRNNKWKCLRDAGLCGRDPPRGIIFSLILEWLFTLYPQEDALSLVTYFRSKFSGDPGLYGCLLELEEVLKLRAGKSFEAFLFTRKDRKWEIIHSLYLPPKMSSVNVLVYDETLSTLDPDMNWSSSPKKSSWSLILLPHGFAVIDVVLVDSSSPANIYGIQITRSMKPFAEHRTFDTCRQESKERLQNLWRAIAGHFQQEFKEFYVMRAPNCGISDFKASKAQESAYFFAPGLPSSSEERPE